MASVQEVLSRMRDALSLSDPDWDVSVGTPEYKILEAVARELTAVYNTGLISDYHFDVETKSSIYLDRFVELFGISRLPAKRATGSVTFSRGTPATEEIFIPVGSQVYRPATSVNPSIYFQTTVLKSIDIGSSSVSVPVEAVVPGTSGNVVSSSISSFNTNIPGVTSVTNPTSITGGTDVESDIELRTRWRSTAFRSIAGTEDSYLNLCLAQDNVTKTLVIGPSLRTIEQLQMSASVAVSQIPDVKYVYPQGNEFVGTGLNTSTEFLAVFNTDYTFSPGPSASISLVAGGEFANGDLVEVEYDYVPLSSRNDPANGILHRVDVFIAGEEQREITEVILFDDSKTFASGGSYAVSNWQRTTGATPAIGSKFMPLIGQPVIDPPATITVGATLRTLNTHYRFVKDVTSAYGSMRAQNGIEWLAGFVPSNGTVLEVEYVQNSLVRDVQDLMNRTKTVGTDLLVHAVKICNYKINLAVVYNKGVAKGTTDDEIEDALTDWFESKFFGSNIQLSDLFNVVRGVIGVDNVRLVTYAEDPSAYGIQKIADDGTTILYSYTSDVYLNSNELPSLLALNAVQKAQNTF